MYNNNGERKMDKTILVVEVIKYRTMPNSYAIKKHADTLEKASEYIVALRNLNEDADTTYKLFNELGQFVVEEIKKIEPKEENEITF
jgi:hypothetical protein|tara:strand:- start:552 stop:812 length:261 start_codon:yes stop_codon:yes gene_type:complete